ncbi:MAG TPA: PD-(D/E)XK nuclease family protein [Longimicrobiales bacterium]|nr:PD-(D/E)XK nuclease family protein [Longimicrobiales bacterium]
MAPLRLILAHDPAILLEQAAEGFLRPPAATPERPFPTPDYLLALRQGGIRDDVLALAAARGVPGWFDPPLCVFHELPAWLGSTDREPCGDVERALLITGVLRRLREGGVFRRVRRPEALVPALDRLFGELVGEGAGPADFARAAAQRQGRDGFEELRDAELAEAYRLYHEELARHGRRDGRDGLADCAAALAAAPAELSRRLGGRREIRLFGLADLRGGWRMLLRSLCASPALDRVEIYTSVRLELDAEVVEVAGPRGVPARVFERGVERAGRIAAFSAASPEREAEEVARRVRELVDGGVAPHRIAVVSRQARPYVEQATAALRAFALPVTARRRFGYPDLPVVRTVVALLDAAAGGWTRHGLVELAEQPYLELGLDAAVLNHVGLRRRVRGLEAWARELDRLLERAESRERAEAEGTLRGDEWQGPLPASERVRRTRDAFVAFRGRVGSLDRTRTLAEWVSWLRELVGEDRWGIEERLYRVPADHLESVRVNQAAWRGLEGMLEEWGRALEAWGGGEERLDAAGAAARLRERLDVDLALWTETMRGVQVLEGLAAAYRSFEHVFLVGLEAGRFPMHAPRSPLLDEEDRQALAAAGVPLETRAEWDVREQELFRSLLAGARSGLTVSWARMDGTGRESIPSAFLEALQDVAEVAPEEIPARDVRPATMPVALGPAPEHAVRVARIERARQAGRPSRHNGVIEDPALVAELAAQFGEARVWSPSQLEELAKCPWAYFSGRLLGLERRDEPEDDLDPAVRGSMLHDALQRFFDAAGAALGGPVLLRAEHREWAGPALERCLAEAIEAAGETWLGHPLLREAKRRELERVLARYLEFEIERNEKLFGKAWQNKRVLRTGVVAHERVFDGVVLERDGVRIVFRGRIDRVEVGVDERVDGAERFLVAIDYKYSRYATPGGGDAKAWADGVVLQVPLYAYALERLEAGKEVARVEYRALKQREPVHKLELTEVDHRTEALAPSAEARAKMEAALDAVARHVRGAREGVFPAEPAPSCGCPPWCHGWDICRVAGGPRKSGW